MAFKKRRMPRRTRRRVRWEQDRVIGCRTHYNVARNATCHELCTIPRTPPFNSTVFVDVQPLLTMTIPFSASPERYPSTMATRRMIFGGMKFESHYSTDPEEWFDAEDCGTPLNSLSFNLSIWEAIVVLPLAQGSTFAPEYIPVLTDPSVQGQDLGDRLLWKRIMQLPMWGLHSPLAVFPQLEGTVMRCQNSGPQVVKVRAAVDDRSGIFFVRQFVHDVVFGDPDELPCQTTVGGCDIPVFNDFWGTLFYRAR